jgi:hypothetical protein
MFASAVDVRVHVSAILYTHAAHRANITRCALNDMIRQSILGSAPCDAISCRQHSSKQTQLTLNHLGQQLSNMTV